MVMLVIETDALACYIESDMKPHSGFRCVPGDDLWEACGFVLASAQRGAIVRHLEASPSQPSLMAESLGMAPSNVSSLLRPMMKRGIVKCLNPSARKGRIYGLTTLGRDVATKLREVRR
jgi:predicted transcriptional regulator